MKIVVSGTGYVGLVTGVCLADKGHDIICVDIDKQRIEDLKKGIVPLFEPGIVELIEKNADRLTFTCDTENSYKQADLIFIAVGTPEKKDGSANLSYVFDVAEQIAEQIQTDCVVAIKSTVPICTNENVEDYIKSNLKHDVKISVASNPEFLSQGTAVADTLNASRIIVGVEDKMAYDTLKVLYEAFDSPLLFTDRRSAEMIKYASNNFLALKISYINEIANLCEIVGSNIDDVAKGMGYDSRIGNKFLRAGIGYGGSCFPKDTKALNWLAYTNDYELKTIKAAIEVNERQKLRLIKKAKEYFESFEDKTFAVLGLTFKPGTDDLREAPSLINIPILIEEKAKIQVWDPVGAENFKKEHPDELIYCDTIEDALNGADICLILTEWKEITDLTAETIKSKMKTPIILDGRNCLSNDVITDSEITYDGIGRTTKHIKFD